MKPIIVVLLTILMITLSTKALSQEETRNTLGVGISLDPARIGQATYLTNTEFRIESSTLINASPVVLYLSFNTSEAFRIEPSFGLFSTNLKQTKIYPLPGNTSVNETSSEISLVSFGLRGFFLSDLSDYVTLYFGPWLGLSFLSSTLYETWVYSYPSSNSTSKGEVTETDVTAGLVFGAEYFPVSTFSVGGECAFNYTSFGNPTVSYSRTPPFQPGYTSSSERKQHSWRTDALFFVRWYFL